MHTICKTVSGLGYSERQLSIRQLATVAVVRRRASAARSGRPTKVR
jgi:hypothetical protein